MSLLDDPVVKWAIDLLNYADPDETGQHMVLAGDLVTGLADRVRLEQAADKLAALCSDEAISNGEIKGLLNRSSARTWGVEYNRSFNPREFVSELERAIRVYVGRRADG